MAAEIDHNSLLTALFATFLNVPKAEDASTSGADVLVQGVPFDLAATGRSGTRAGPPAIRLASANVEWEGIRWPWDFDALQELAVEDMGDISFKHGIVGSMIDTLEKQTDAILDAGKIPLTFGGDHFIALPLLRSIARKHGRVALIHFDAHTDTYPSEDYHHGTMFYHAEQEGLLDPSRSVQIGIRTGYEKESHTFNVLDARQVNREGPEAIGAKIREIVGDMPAYISFDIDCIDPAFAPGTGTPVVGGLTTDCALELLRQIKELDLTGMDLVEVSPPYDSAQITALAGATLALEFLNLLAWKKREANH